MNQFDGKGFQPRIHRQCDRRMPDRAEPFFSLLKALGLRLQCQVKRRPRKCSNSANPFGLGSKRRTLSAKSTKLCVAKPLCRYTATNAFERGQSAGAKPVVPSTHTGLIAEFRFRSCCEVPVRYPFGWH